MKLIVCSTIHAAGGKYPVCRVPASALNLTNVFGDYALGTYFGKSDTGTAPYCFLYTPVRDTGIPGQALQGGSGLRIDNTYPIECLIGGTFQWSSDYSGDFPPTL